MAQRKRGFVVMKGQTSALRPRLKMSGKYASYARFHVSLRQSLSTAIFYRVAVFVQLQIVFRKDGIAFRHLGQNNRRIEFRSNGYRDGNQARGTKSKSKENPRLLDRLRDRK